MRVQDIKKKTWDTKGTIVSVEFHEGAQTPSSYHIDADEGGNFLRNGRFIRLLEEQASSQKEGSDNQDADLDKDSLGDEKAEELEGRVSRHTRKQVQFREQTRRANKAQPSDERS